MYNFIIQGGNIYIEDHSIRERHNIVAIWWVFYVISMITASDNAY